MVGLAVGDALGTTNEFQSADTLSPITDMVGGGVFGLEPGQWTDDTSMALCLADSLLAQGRYDSVDVMERYERWRREGYRSSTGWCFDIGNQVSHALDAFDRERRVPRGAPRSASAGNGSIMRLAPVVIAGCAWRSTASSISPPSTRPSWPWRTWAGMRTRTPRSTGSWVGRSSGLRRFDHRGVI